MSLFLQAFDKMTELSGQVLVDHKVGEGADDEISVNRRGAYQQQHILAYSSQEGQCVFETVGGTTWEDNPLVNLAAREGRARCVKELVENWGASIEIKVHAGYSLRVSSLTVGDSD